MTREETKKRFRSWCQEHIGNNASDEDYHMFNNIMALLEQEPCDDCISRQAVLDMATTIQTDDFSGNEIIEVVEVDDVKALPPVTPEKTTITYKDCSEAMLKMWIDNVLTDGQYNKIMDKLNAKHIKDMKGGE